MNVKKIIFGICFIAGLVGMYYLGTQNYFENSVFLQKIKNIVTNLTQEPTNCNSDEVVENAQEEQPSVEASLPVAIAPSNEVINITTQYALRDLIKEHKEPAIIFFHMDNCGFCKKMDPVLHEIVKNSRFDAIKFYSVNGRDLQAPVIVQELVDQKINGYPFFLFMDENGYLNNHAGYKPQQDFEAKIAEIFGNLIPADVNPQVQIQAVETKSNENSKPKTNQKKDGKSSQSQTTTPKIKEFIEKFVSETDKIPGDCKSSKKEPKEKIGEIKEKSDADKKQEEATKKEKHEKIEQAYQAYKKLYDEAKKMNNELVISKEDNEKVKKSAVKLFDCRNIKNMVWRAWKVESKQKPQVKQAQETKKQ